MQLLHRMMKILSLIKKNTSQSEHLTFLTTRKVLRLSSHLQDMEIPQNSKLTNPTVITQVASSGQGSLPTPSSVFTLSSSSTFSPLDVNMLGVPQPNLATKDILIIIFMLMFWGYSLYLTYRAWYKLLYSDTGEERSNMWRSDIYNLGYWVNID